MDGLPHVHISGMEFLVTFFYVILAIGVLHIIGRHIGDNHPAGEALFSCFA